MNLIIMSKPRDISKHARHFRHISHRTTGCEILVNEEKASNCFSYYSHNYMKGQWSQR